MISFGEQGPSAADDGADAAGGDDGSFYVDGHEIAVRACEDVALCAFCANPGEFDGDESTAIPGGLHLSWMSGSLLICLSCWLELREIAEQAIKSFSNDHVQRDGVGGGE